MFKNCIKTVLTLKAQLKNNYTDIFLDFFNIQTTIIVLKKLFKNLIFFWKMYLKYSKKILRIK
jgi:hypothetical protein